MEWIRAESTPELEEAMGTERGAPLWIVKHSTRCGASAHAFLQVERFRERYGRDDWLLVEVPRQRELAAAVAERTGVRHESPQVLLLVDGVVRWRADHWAIDADSLDRAACEVLERSGPVR